VRCADEQLEGQGFVLRGETTLWISDSRAQGVLAQPEFLFPRSPGDFQDADFPENGKRCETEARRAGAAYDDRRDNGGQEGDP
jgi:hypothetical protein